MRQLEGKTAIVTGAGSGIGLGLARTFARHGMSVVLCDIRGDRLDAALAEVRGLTNARAIAVPTDVSDRASVRNAADQALRAFGALHVACNNAGVVIQGRSVADLAPQEWDWIIDPDDVGERVVHAIRRRELYLFTHMHTRECLLTRHQQIIDAYGDCERWQAERSGRPTAQPA